jgi:pSer/pThr/pTyr-binding forkhead associated (FHA) protein
MVDQILLLFQALFLVLLYLFIWRVMRTASRDLRLPQESFFLAPSQVPSAAPTAGGVAHAVLRVEASPSLQEGASVEVGAAPVTVGRSPDNSLPLPADEYSSAHHARIELLRDGLWILDLGSTNGSFVNGKPIDGRARLRPGDVVRIGDTRLRVVS